MAESTTTTKTVAAPAITTPKVGDIVLVRSSAKSFVPAIVVNDFQGQNAPGVVSLVVFLAEQFQSPTPVKYVAAAQAETAEIPDKTLAEESYAWWSLPGKGRELKEV